MLREGANHGSSATDLRTTPTSGRRHAHIVPRRPGNHAAHCARHSGATGGILRPRPLLRADPVRVA